MLIACVNQCLATKNTKRNHNDILYFVYEFYLFYFIRCANQFYLFILSKLILLYKWNKIYFLMSLSVRHVLYHVVTSLTELVGYPWFY